MNDEKLTATERLRQLLDERGVEWEPIDGDASTYVDYKGEAWRFDYDEPFDQLAIVCLSGYTPEQAVEATLGEEVVRCRDCESFESNYSDGAMFGASVCWGWDNGHDYPCFTHPDGFCHKGVRRGA